MAPPEPPSPMMAATSGTWISRQASIERGDGLGLAARLGVDAGIGAGGVDEGQHRQAEAVGQLASAGAPCGSPRAAPCRNCARSRASVSAPFSVPSTTTLRPRNRPMPADHGGVLGKGAVAGERRELGDQRRRCSRAPCGRSGWRATCIFCHGVSRGVGCAQQAVGGGGRAAPTSSAMLSAAGLDRWRSSSILPSSSAIGCSKSRKWRFTGGVLADVRSRPAGAAGPPGHACRSGWSRCRRAPASAARC